MTEPEFEFSQPSEADARDMVDLASLFKTTAAVLMAGEKKYSRDAVGVALVRAGLETLGSIYNTASLAAWLERTIIELERGELR